LSSAAGVRAPPPARPRLLLRHFSTPQPAAGGPRLP
jgi:hypothetical protein